MIAQNGGLMGAQRFGDLCTFTRFGDQYFCVVIENVILIKRTCLLVDWVKTSTESGPSSAKGGMGVRCGIYCGPRLVNLVVDSERGNVNVSTTFDDLTSLINAHEIGRLYLSEMH